MFLDRYYIFVQQCLFLIIFAVAVTAVTPVDECRNNPASRPIEVDVVNCTKQPCQFRKSTDIVIYLTFKATEHIDTLRASVIAHVDGTDVPYPLLEPNACNTLVNTNCPLKVNEISKYRLDMFISTLFPKMPFELRVSLKANGKNEDIVCFNIQAEIV